MCRDTHTHHHREPQTGPAVAVFRCGLGFLTNAKKTFLGEAGCVESDDDPPEMDEFVVEEEDVVDFGLLVILVVVVVGVDPIRA